MSGMTESVRLIVGIEVDGVVHRDCLLRLATLEDEYLAIEMVPIPDGVADDLRLNTAYHIRVDDARLLHQVVQLGTLSPAPLPAALIGMIDPDDMVLLRGAAESLKKKWRQSRLSSSPSDSLKPPSLAPASA